MIFFATCSGIFRNKKPGVVIKRKRKIGWKPDTTPSTSTESVQENLVVDNLEDVNIIKGEKIFQIPSKIHL